MTIATFRIHTISTDWHPIPEIGNWPLDHVFVSTSEGKSWGCFGRGLPDVPDAKVIAEGKAILEWVSEIAGNFNDKYCAGITHQVNGICHNAANRLLLPANIDASKAPGNEIATPIFGKFGLGIDDFLQIIKDSSYRVNNKFSGLISEEMVEAAISQVTHSKNEEIDILTEDINNFFSINVQNIPLDIKNKLLSIYTELYTNRHSIYKDFKKGVISATRYNDMIRENIINSLEEAKLVLGSSAYFKIFKLPPHIAALYATGKNNN